jgi:alkyl sulfatase BDS1-like metallo-beta-lactamase superfamily hydrolase
VHDQTLRLLNKGFNGPEIAEQMLLPPALDQAWNARGYYGSVNHNVKAIYQRYVGWFDGNPAHLWEHIPVERAKRYVDLAGGLDKIVEQGQAAFDKGDFRWAAEILNHAVFANPNPHPLQVFSPIPTNSSDMEPRMALGGASSSRGPLNCARATLAPPHKRPRTM